MTEKSYGIVPIQVRAGQLYVLLVRHATRSQHWSLPKGHKESHEDDREAALREFQEETGITNVEISNDTTYRERYFFRQNNALVTKEVTYFLGRVKDPSVTIQKSEITDYQWLPIDEAVKVATFKETKRVLQNVKEELEA